MFDSVAQNRSLKNDVGHAFFMSENVVSWSLGKMKMCPLGELTLSVASQRKKKKITVVGVYAAQSVID